LHDLPSGDPEPSREDIEMTKGIRKAAATLGISIHDQQVIGCKGACEVQEPRVIMGP
jgi:DNA repair protein RadC